MSYKCLHCQKSFTARQALCEDWRDPEKSVGCPHCGLFQKQDLRPNLQQSILVGVMAGGIATPAVFLVGRGISSADALLLFYGVVILISCAAALILSVRS